MTTSRRAKQDARDEQAVTGSSYVAARRATLNPTVPERDGGKVFLDDMCANCLRPIAEERNSLFCSDFCQETTKHVRYFRRVFRDGRIGDPDVQIAVNTRIAFLSIGGYDALGRTLVPAVRAAVIERDKGVCQSCGRPGTEIDHIAGSSDVLENLKLLCVECHRDKTQLNMTEGSPEFKERIDELFERRVMPDVPVLLADDDEAWAGRWRALKKARNDRLRDELEGLGFDPVRLGIRSREDMIEIRDDTDWGSGEDYNGPEDYDGGFGPDSYFAHAMAKDD